MRQVTLVLIRRGDQLYPFRNSDRVKLQAFTDSLKEGQKVDIFLSEYDSADHTLAQLAKFHATVRDLSIESGQDPQEIKDLIKEEIGLTKVDGDGNVVLKSFKECTKEELMLAISQAVKYADMLGIRLPDRMDNTVKSATFSTDDDDNQTPGNLTPTSS